MVHVTGTLTYTFDTDDEYTKAIALMDSVVSREAEGEYTVSSKDAQIKKITFSFDLKRDA